jgi:hypothetical protein
MPSRLTTPQLRDIKPGDVVARQLLGHVQTAPVAKITRHQIVVEWPCCEVARYWRESGSRLGCDGEVLRQPPQETTTTGDWLTDLGFATSAEAEKYGLTVEEKAVLYSEIHDTRTELGVLFEQCASVAFGVFGTARLLVSEIVKRRTTLVARPEWSIW